MTNNNTISDSLQMQVKTLTDEALLKALKRTNRRRSALMIAFAALTLGAIWLPWHWQLALTALMALLAGGAAQAGLNALATEARSRIKTPHQKARAEWAEHIKHTPPCDIHPTANGHDGDVTR